jgi:Ca2+-binding RTX toxin-like protein
MKQVVGGTSEADDISAFSTGSYEDDFLAFGGGGADMITSARGDDRLWGGKGGNTIIAYDGDDALAGGRGDDTLDGWDGEDTLAAGRGDDQLQGGFGIDVLVGGRGADTFAFGAVVGSRGGSLYYEPDTGVGEGARDIVRDFEQGLDKIDLKRINFVSDSVGPPGSPVIPGSDLKFEFTGTDAFTGDGDQPQARFEMVGGRTVIQLDGVRYAAAPGRATKAMWLRAASFMPSFAWCIQRRRTRSGGAGGAARRSAGRRRVYPA